MKNNNKLHQNIILSSSKCTITQPSFIAMVVFMFKLISATLVAVLPLLWAIAPIIKYFKYVIR